VPHLLTRELFPRRFVFSAARYSIVPQNCIFHERNALALHGMRDDAAGPCGGFATSAQRLSERVVIVTVHLFHGPSKALPLLYERLETERILGRFQALNLVVIDDRSQPT